MSPAQNSENQWFIIRAANHVSEILEESDDSDPRHLLIIGYGINFIDVSGSLVLEQERTTVKTGNIFSLPAQPGCYPVSAPWRFLKQIGENRLFATEYQAISQIFNILDKSICRTCTARIFEECRRVPGPGSD